MKRLLNSLTKKTRPLNPDEDTEELVELAKKDRLPALLAMFLVFGPIILIFVGGLLLVAYLIVF